MALLSDVLGAGVLGIKNILALAGDHVSLGDTPDAKPVFDLDSILVGIFPAKSFGAADFFDKYVAGVDVPPDYLKSLEATKEIKEKKKQEIDRINVEFFTSFLEYLKGTPAAGCHMMAVGYPRIIAPLKKVMGV